VADIPADSSTKPFFAGSTSSFGLVASPGPFSIFATFFPAVEIPSGHSHNRRKAACNTWGSLLPIDLSPSSLLIKALLLSSAVRGGNQPYPICRA
jgi:hypothetical protein